jgi:hypothetical protein
MREAYAPARGSLTLSDPLARRATNYIYTNLPFLSSVQGSYLCATLVSHTQSPTLGVTTDFATQPSKPP